MVKDYSDQGSITLTANKIYNIWANSGNKTSYTVDIESPYIRSTRQEIRVAIQWQWKTRLGIASERVAFYGSGDRFDQFRVDNHIDSGSYDFPNAYLPALPKNSAEISPQSEADIAKYVFITKDGEGPEISLENRTARFTFEVSRDEPYGGNNRVWINWGVFESQDEASISKVQGIDDYHLYGMQPTYDDYFDRVFINGIYWVLLATGTFTY